MKMRDILFERRSAPLYHATGLVLAQKIVAEDTIAANTSHIIDGKKVMGVSLSRSPRKTTQFGEIIFQLDQAKLVQRSRLIPHNYWQRDHNVARPAGDVEAEEFCLGAITPLSRYLTTIWIPALPEPGLRMRASPDGAAARKSLLAHPQARIYAIDSRSAFQRSFR